MGTLGKRWKNGPLSEEHRKKLSLAAIAKYQKIPKEKRFKTIPANYQGWHSRIKRLLGSPKICFVCDTTSVIALYEWANLTGKYDNIMDYRRMCHSCHKKYDMKRRCEFFKQNGHWPMPQAKQWNQKVSIQ